MQKIQSAVTGGISASFILIPKNNDTYSLALQVSSKSLEKNEPQMQELIASTVSKSKFNEKERIKDLLNFISSANERSVIQNGHVLAMSNASAQINNIAATNDMGSGINLSLIHI